MKQILGLILAIVGFIGLFCEAETIGWQVVVTALALALFAAGVALLGGFNETTLKHITK